jgi:hypothetical protein
MSLKCRETLSVASQNLRATEIVSCFSHTLFQLSFNAFSSKFLKKMDTAAGNIPTEWHGSKTADNIHGVLLFIHNP